MKKITLLLVFFLVVLSLCAQNSALSVPKFKGIEITGTVNQFGSKLKDKGFVFVDKLNDQSCYMGRFAGVDDCLIYLLPVENSNDLASVGVVIGIHITEYEIYTYETWESLLKDYGDLKALLIEKYGEPNEQNAGFSPGAITSTSYTKLSSVSDGKCEYYAIWGNPDVDKMIVKLSIVGIRNMGVDYAVIALSYTNVEKNKDSRKEILDDL